MSIPALLGSSLPLPSLRSIRNPVVKHSLKIWAQFRKHFGFHSFSLLSPIASNFLFKPSCQDSAFQEWHRKGIVCFKDLFIDNSLASFEQLSRKFSLPKSNFFRYLQARHFVLSQTTRSATAVDSTIVDTILSIDPLKKRLISVLYGKLLELNSAPTDKLKTAWEEDLGFPLSEDTWVSILKLVNSTSLCARHCLIQFKVVHRAHISKAKLSSIYPDISPYCVKCKHVEASLIHMYWSCSDLGKYWREVFHTLSRVLKVKLEPNPLTALFGVMGGEKKLTTAKQRILSFASLLARRAILLRWKDTLPPTHAQWLEDIMSCLKLEKIRHSLQHSNEKFQKVWGPFLKEFQTL